MSAAAPFGLALPQLSLHQTGVYGFFFPPVWPMSLKRLGPNMRRSINKVKVAHNKLGLTATFCRATSLLVDPMYGRAAWLR